MDRVLDTVPACTLPSAVHGAFRAHTLTPQAASPWLAVALLFPEWSLLSLPWFPMAERPGQGPKC